MMQGFGLSLTLGIILLGSATVATGAPPDSSQYKQHIMDKLQDNIYNARVAKNIILILVEGLDSTTIAAARKMVSDTTPMKNNFMSTLDNGFVTGFLKPSSFDSLVADPAAVTSSIFNGVLEYNGQMGWVEQGDADCTQFDRSKKTLKNIFKIMSEQGNKETALLTTARLTSPGVAGTYGVTPDMQIESDIHLRESGCDRGSLKDLAKQLVTEYTDLNVIVGSGRNYFHKNKDGSTDNLPEAREDLDLKPFWAVDKLLKKKSFKNADGIPAIKTALGDTKFLEHLLGFIEENDESFKALRGLLVDTLKNFNEKQNSSGYFIVTYIDQLAKHHEESKAFYLGPSLNEILKMIHTIDSMLRGMGDDTLIVLASTQGSTLTLGSGSLLTETLFDVSRTDECEPHTYLNYAFGPQQNAEYNEKISQADYQYQSLHNGRGVTGGPDLPIFAKGPGSHIFTGINDWAFLYHALLYATCLTHQAEQFYEHCAVVPTTSPPLTTTTMPPVQQNTQGPFQPPVYTQRPPYTQRPFIVNWPWVPQPRPLAAANPYGALGGSTYMNLVNNANRNPLYTVSRNTNQNTNQNLNTNAWNWASIFPFFL